MKPTLRDYLGISLFWFALSFFWGAVLILVLPDRVEQIVGSREKDHALAVITSVGAFVASATQILFGAISDRSRHRMGRRRPYLIVGTLLTTVALFAFPAARTVWTLLGVYIMIQFFLNVANGPYQALIPDRIPWQYHGTASAWMGICTLLGRIGGPFAASLLLGTERGLFWLMVLFALFLNLFMLANVWLVREEPYTGNSPSLWESITSSYRVPLKPYPSFVWLLISRLAIMMGIYTVNFCLLYYLRDTLGYREEAFQLITNFMILSTITGVLATIPAGRLSDRYSKRLILAISCIICLLAGTGFWVAHDLRVVYVAVGIFGAGFGVFQAVDWALACNFLPQDEPAKYMGVWGIADTLPQVVAPLIAGPIAFAINTQVAMGTGYRALMMLAMVYWLAGTVVIRYIRERKG
ncbi:MAG: MFS transporter [Armatimonadota bacterium]